MDKRGLRNAIHEGIVNGLKEIFRTSGIVKNSIAELIRLYNSNKHHPDWRTATCAYCGHNCGYTGNEMPPTCTSGGTMPIGYCREKGIFVKGECPACPTYEPRSLDDGE